jgi:hypothetical protein
VDDLPAVKRPHRTPNVLLFTDPATGRQDGYWDGWVNDEVFHYTGEGQHGDQRLERTRRSWTRAGITPGSSSPTRSTAAAISHRVPNKPVFPSTTTSGTDPLCQATTGSHSHGLGHDHECCFFSQAWGLDTVAPVDHLAHYRPGLALSRSRSTTELAGTREGVDLEASRRDPSWFRSSW